MQGGATAAECVVREGDEFSTVVRLGQVETLKESGSKAIGVRVFFGQRAASTYSSDFSRAGLDRMLKSALELAKITSEDPFAGIPEADATRGSSLAISISITRMCTRSRRRANRLRPPRRESCARFRSAHQELRRRIVRCRHRPQGSGQLARFRWRILAVPIARLRPFRSRRRRWRHAARLLVFGRAQPGETRLAGKSWARSRPERTLRRLGARKAKTAQVPVVFDPMVANSILEHIFEGVNGDSVYRGASFLAGKLGQKIAADNVTIIDDGTIPGGFGTSPFDGEGIPTRRTVVIENGVLKSYLSEHLHGEKARSADDRQCFARTGRHSRHRSGKLFLQAGPRAPQGNHRRNQGRTCTYRVSRPRRESGHRRLLARRIGPVDIQR